jgi:sulfotransferase 6B1
MTPFYTAKHWLKIVRWQGRRVAAAAHWGNEALQAAPIVLGNAMPKSGSHLIIQVLQGLTQLGPFVDPGFPPVNRSEDNQKLPDAAVLANIQHMRPGDIGYGYIGAQEPFVSALTATRRATIFVYRDPRDMIISHIFYATTMHEGHWMRHYYNEVLHTMEERINAAIQGVDAHGSELTPISERYAGYLGWLEWDQVLCLRFEDLILAREAALGRLVDYLGVRSTIAPSLALEGRGGARTREETIEVLSRAIAPKRSGTFRKGKPGNWQEHFTEANKALFKEKAGHLLIQLGYEKDDNW